METILDNNQEWKQLFEASRLKQLFKSVHPNDSASTVYADLKSTEKFNREFLQLQNNTLLPLVTDMNKDLAPAGLELQVIGSGDAKTHSTLVIVLKAIDTQINIMRDPYLLIDGNVAKNTVRIVPGRSKDEGKEILISQLSKSQLVGAIAAWLHILTNK